MNNKIKLLGLSFSPRSDSNSTYILRYIFKHLKKTAGANVEIELFAIKDYRINSCLACDVCGKQPDGTYSDCVISDDMNKFYEKIKLADGLIIVTPVHMGLPSELYTKFMMRTRLLRHQDFAMKDKVCGVISVAQRRGGGGETAIIASWLPLYKNNCIMVGRGDKSGDIGVICNARARKEVKDDEKGLDASCDLGVRVYELSKLIKAGKEALGDDYKPIKYEKM